MKPHPDPDCTKCDGNGYYVGGAEAEYDIVACACSEPSLPPEIEAGLVAWLKENLTVHTNFDVYRYGSENELTVTIKIGDEVVSESTTRIEPRISDGY